MSAPDAATGAGAPGGPFSPLTAVLMTLVGVFAFSALMVLAAYAPDLERGDNGGGHALSKSAIGFAGMVEALRLAGDPVLVNRAPLRPGRRRGLLIVTPSLDTTPAAIDALTFDGPVLIVLPKWVAAPNFRHRGWVGQGQPIDPDLPPPGSLMRVLGARHRAGAASPVLAPPPGTGTNPLPGAPLRPGALKSPQSIAAPGWIPVLVDETGATMLARSPRGARYVLSEPDLLNNQGIGDPATFAAGLTLLRGLRLGDGPVMFDVRLNGLGRERSVPRLLFDPPFLAVTLCLAAAAGLAGFQAFARFGPVRRGGRAIPLGKTALVDNTAALIRLAGREHRMGGRYADLTAALAARSAGAPRGLGGEALTAFLDRLSHRRGLPQPLSELAIQARMARTPEAAVAAARRLRQWRLAVTGEGAAAGPPEA
jgi:hypothetical protein